MGIIELEADIGVKSYLFKFRPCLRLDHLSSSFIADAIGATHAKANQSTESWKTIIHKLWKMHLAKLENWLNNPPNHQMHWVKIWGKEGSRWLPHPSGRQQWGRPHQERGCCFLLHFHSLTHIETEHKLRLHIVAGYLFKMLAVDLTDFCWWPSIKSAVQSKKSISTHLTHLTKQVPTHLIYICTYNIGMLLLLWMAEMCYVKFLSFWLGVFDSERVLITAQPCGGGGQALGSR